MPNRAAAIRFLLGNRSCGGSIGLRHHEIQVRSIGAISIETDKQKEFMMSEVKAGGTAMQKDCHLFDQHPLEGFEADYESKPPLPAKITPSPVYDRLKNKRDRWNSGL